MGAFLWQVFIYQNHMIDAKFKRNDGNRGKRQFGKGKSAEKSGLPRRAYALFAMTREGGSPCNACHCEEDLENPTWQSVVEQQVEGSGVAYLLQGSIF